MRDPTLGLRVGSSSICRLHVATSGKGPTTIRTKMVTQSHDDVAKKRGDQRASEETPKLVPHNFREDGDRQPPVDLGRRQSDANDDVPEPPYQIDCSESDTADKVRSDETDRYRRGVPD